MFVQMLGMVQSFFAQQPRINFGQFQGMLSYQQIAFPITRTAATRTIQVIKEFKAVLTRGILI